MDHRTAMSTVLFTDKYLYRRKKFYEASPMPLRIKDPATEKSVGELVAPTGETVTTAVRRAAEERLQRVRRSHGGHSLAAEMLEIGKHCASLRDLDTPG
jgi:antitoxin VapB